MRTGQGFYTVRDFVWAAEAELRYIGQPFDYHRFLSCLWRSLQEETQEEVLYFNTFRGTNRVWLPPYVRDVKAVYYLRHPVVVAIDAATDPDGNHYISVVGRWRHIGDVGDRFILYSPYLAEREIRSAIDPRLPVGYFPASKQPFEATILTGGSRDNPAVAPDEVFWGTELPSDWNIWAYGWGMVLDHELGFLGTEYEYVYVEEAVRNNLFSFSSPQYKYLVLYPKGVEVQEGLGLWEYIQPHTGHTFSQRHYPKRQNWWVFRPPYLEFRNPFPYTGVRSLAVEAVVSLPKWDIKSVEAERFPSWLIPIHTRSRFSAILYRSIAYYLVPLLPQMVQVYLQMSASASPPLTASGEGGSVRSLIRQTDEEGLRGYGMLPPDLAVHQSQIWRFGTVDGLPIRQHGDPVVIRIYHPVSKELVWSATVREGSWVVVPTWVRDLVVPNLETPPVETPFIQMVWLAEPSFHPSTPVFFLGKEFIPAQPTDVIQTPFLGYGA